MNAEFPTITTARLNLRAVTGDDAALYHQLLSVPEVTLKTDIPDSPTEKRSERFVSWMSGLYQKDKGCAWIIENRETHALMGAIRINQIFRKEKTGEIGYELHPEYWGRGFMSEALTAVITCGYEHFSLNRLEAWTLPGNEVSDQVLLKCGFSFEGVLRQKACFKGGFHDLRVFSRLATDREIK